jgi:hypothetical protein
MSLRSKAIISTQHRLKLAGKGEVSENLSHEKAVKPLEPNSNPTASLFGSDSF